MDGLETIITSQTGQDFRIRCLRPGPPIVGSPVWEPFPTNAFPDEIEIEESYNADFPIGIPESEELRLVIDLSDFTDSQVEIIAEVANIAQVDTVDQITTVSGIVSSYPSGVTLVSEIQFTDASGFSYVDSTQIRIAANALYPITVNSAAPILDQNGNFEGYGTDSPTLFQSPPPPPPIFRRALWSVERRTGPFTWSPIFVGCQRSSPPLSIEFNGAGYQRVEVIAVHILRLAAEAIDMNAICQQFVSASAVKYRKFGEFYSQVVNSVFNEAFSLTRNRIMLLLPTPVAVLFPPNNQPVTEMFILVNPDQSQPPSTLSSLSDNYLADKLPTAYDFLAAFAEFSCSRWNFAESSQPLLNLTALQIRESNGSIVPFALDDSIGNSRFQSGSDIIATVCEFPVIERTRSVRVSRQVSHRGSEYSIYCMFHTTQTTGPVSAANQPALLFKAAGEPTDSVGIRFYEDVSTYSTTNNGLAFGISSFITEWANKPNAGIYEFSTDMHYLRLGTITTAYRSRLGASVLGIIASLKYSLRSGVNEYKVRTF